MKRILLFASAISLFALFTVLSCKKDDNPNSNNWKPCPGFPTVTDIDGNVYNTVLIGDQCWMKENLNVGTIIPGSQNQSNNGTIEKYCYNNEPDSCTKYGGLYQWTEMMQYTYQQGAQGICPPGWHLPTDEEWKVLEGVVDSQYGIGHYTWDYVGFRGSNAGTNLKSTSGWSENGNGNDLFGFSGLPGGDRRDGGIFYAIGIGGVWWSSTSYDDIYKWNRTLSCNSQEVARGYTHNIGFSVRCLKD